MITTYRILNRVSRIEAGHPTLSRLEPMGPGSRSLPHLSRSKQSSPSNALSQLPIGPTPIAEGQPRSLEGCQQCQLHSAEK